MKHLIWIGAVVVAILLFVFFAGDKQETAVAPAEETPAIADQVEEAAEQAAATAEDTSSETLVVVEESAAEAEPEDESIVLAVADEPVAPREWQFKEGEHYVRMVPTQPTVGGADKIEVAEFVKLRVTQQGVQGFIVTLKHLEQAQPVSVGVNTQPRARIYLGRPHHLVLNAGVVVQYIILEFLLQDG